MIEEPLYGGLVDGRCVRVGDTVRRPWLASSPAVQDLLGYLERSGFEGAPRPLGRDERGREVVSWVEGIPSFGPEPPPLLQPGALTELGEFARRLHGALHGYRPPRGARWQSDRTDGPVVHGDLGAWNIIWSGGRPVAAVDWESAGPGERLDDIALLAKSAVPLVPDEQALPLWETIPERRGRLIEFCRGYGVKSSTLLEWMLDRPTGADEIIARGRAGEEPWATYYQRGLHERSNREREWLRSWCRALPVHGD